MEELWYKRGYFGPLRNTHILVYYPIIYLMKTKIYRVETMDMVRLQYNNGVIVILNTSK